MTPSQNISQTHAGRGSDTACTSNPARARYRPPPAPGRRAIPPKLYRIGEIVDYSGVSRQTIHNYTIMGLITESRRTGGGHRLYDESVFARLDLIDELKRQHRSMRDIRGHFAKLDSQAENQGPTNGPE